METVNNKLFSMTALYSRRFLTAAIKSVANRLEFPTQFLIRLLIEHRKIVTK